MALIYFKANIIAETVTLTQKSTMKVLGVIFLNKISFLVEAAVAVVKKKLLLNHKQVEGIKEVEPILCNQSLITN
jgi:hypothetical protein